MAKNVKKSNSQFFQAKQIRKRGTVWKGKDGQFIYRDAKVPVLCINIMIRITWFIAGQRYPKECCTVTDLIS